MIQLPKDIHSPKVEFFQKVLLPRISIFLIIVVAFVLRFWSIDFGLPYSYHIDEIDYTKVALNLACNGDLNTTLFQPQTYVHAISLWGMNLFNPNTCANYPSVTSISQALFLSRLISAIFGTLTVIVIFRLGDRLFGFPIGIIAALFTTVNFLHVRESHFGTPDITAGFFLVAALLSYVNVSQNRTLRNYLIATVLTIMAVSGRLTLLLLVLPLSYVHLLPFFSTMPKSLRVLKDFILNRYVMICLAVAVITFLILTPVILINPQTYMAYWRNFFSLSRLGGFGRFKVDELSAPIFYLRTFIWSYGLLLSLIIGSGLIWAVWKRKFGDILLLSFTIAYLVIASRAGTYFSRYIIPATLPLGILAARFIWEGWPQRKMGLGLISTLIVISVQPLICIFQFDNLLHQEDTRTIALEWINSHIPQGAKLAVEYHTPFVDTHSFNVTVVDIHGSWQTDISEYCKQHFEYLINSSFVDNLLMIDSVEEMEKQAFYAELDKSAKLIYEIRPYSAPTAPPFYFDQIFSPITSLDQFDRPGPTLKIYQLETGTSGCQ